MTPKSFEFAKALKDRECTSYFLLNFNIFLSTYFSTHFLAQISFEKRRVATSRFSKVFFPNLDHLSTLNSQFSEACSKVFCVYRLSIY
jgi:hypothetical protein